MSRGSFVLSAVMAAVMAAGGGLNAVASGGNGGKPSNATAAENQKLGRKMAAEGYGWSGEQWDCLRQLWHGESGWNHEAENPSSGAYGIPQSLPADKMSAAGSDWRTNPATQIEWGLAYIEERPGEDYGDPCTALAKWESRDPHWY